MQPFTLASPPAPLGWSVLRETRAHDGAHAQVDEVVVQTPARPDREAKWTVVRRKPAVAVAAYLDDGRWVLIQQERIPVQQALWEFPAGQIDAGSCADAAEMQQRVEATTLSELREEAGLTLAPGGKLEHLGHIFLSPGFTDEVCYLVLAGPMQQTEAAAGVGGEVITQQASYTTAELGQMVLSGQLCNALAVALYGKIAARLNSVAL
jgi:ADP-ribose pyrophosphatase